MQAIPLGNRLKELRRRAGISQAALSAAVGIKQPAYARYELSEVMPPYPVLIALADYYAVSTDYLLGRSAHPEGRMFGEAGRAREERLAHALALCFCEGSEPNERLKALLRDALAAI